MEQAKTVVKYLHAGVFLVIDGGFSSLSNGEKGCPACIFKLLYVARFLLLLFLALITFQALFFHSGLLFLAFPLVLKKDDEASLTGIPKRSLHFILHYLTLQLIRKVKQSSSQPSFSYRHNRYSLFSYNKDFQIVRHLKGSALCLLKTQYAKKPKNPV